MQAGAELFSVSNSDQTQNFLRQLGELGSLQVFLALVRLGILSRLVRWGGEHSAQPSEVRLGCALWAWRGGARPRPAIHLCLILYLMI